MAFVEDLKNNLEDRMVKTIHKLGEELSAIRTGRANANMLDMIKVEKQELVPEHKKRQGVNPPPYFLCDKILYSLGIGKEKSEGAKRFKQYCEYNIKLLQQSDYR